MTETSPLEPEAKNLSLNLQAQTSSAISMKRIADTFEGVRDMIRREMVREGNVPAGPSYQESCVAWVSETFALPIVVGRQERIQRFFEEAVELAEACGGHRDVMHQLVDWVYDKGRPGDIGDEIGGVMITLHLLGDVWGLDTQACADGTLHSANERKEQIRAKQITKPVFKPRNGDA